MTSLLQAHGTHEELVRELEAELQAAPDNPQLHLRMAAVMLEHGDWQQTLIEAEKVDRLSDGSSPTSLLKGKALALGGQLSAAKAVLDEFLERDGNSSAAFLERARINDKIMRPAASLADYRTALQCAVNPEPDVYVEVADALVKQSLNDEAISVLQQGITQLGSVPQLVLKAMDLEIATKRFDAALARIAVMQKLMPRPEPWMAKRASILAQAGRSLDSLAAWYELHGHIAALPNLERGSNAMCLLMEQAATAIDALQSLSTNTALPTPARP